MLAALLLLVPFLSNLAMSGIKWLFAYAFRDTSTRNWRLRLILTVLSLVGVVASWALNGTPIDPNVVTQDITMIVEVIALAIASHFTYKVIKST